MPSLTFHILQISSQRILTIYFRPQFPSSNICSTYSNRVQGGKCASQCKRSITCQNMSPAPSGLSKIIICASSSPLILSLLKITHVSSHKTGLAILIVSFNFLVPGQFESTSGEYERRGDCAIQLVGVALLRFLSSGTDEDAAGHPHADPTWNSSMTFIQDPLGLRSSS